MSERRYTSKDVCTSCWYDNCEGCRSADCACRRHNHPDPPEVCEDATNG